MKRSDTAQQRKPNWRRYRRTTKRNQLSAFTLKRSVQRAVLLVAPSYWSQRKRGDARVFSIWIRSLRRRSRSAFGERPALFCPRRLMIVSLDHVPMPACWVFETFVAVMALMWGLAGAIVRGNSQMKFDVKRINVRANSLCVEVRVQIAFLSETFTAEGAHARPDRY